MSVRLKGIFFVYSASEEATLDKHKTETVNTPDSHIRWWGGKRQRQAHARCNQWTVKPVKKRGGRGRFHVHSPMVRGCRQKLKSRVPCVWRSAVPCSDRKSLQGSRWPRGSVPPPDKHSPSPAEEGSRSGWPHTHSTYNNTAQKTCHSPQPNDTANKVVHQARI